MRLRTSLDGRNYARTVEMRFLMIDVLHVVLLVYVGNKCAVVKHEFFGKNKKHRS